MTEGEFQKHMARLMLNYGKAAYSPERSRLIFSEIAALSESWWAKVVDRFIGESRQAPMLPEFRDMASEERERVWEIEKKENARAAKRFFSDSYAPEEKKHICQMIQKRLRGEVSTQDYQSFMSSLKSVADNAGKICSHCDGKGYKFKKVDGYEYVFRCACPAGKAKQTAIPMEG